MNAHTKLFGEKDCWDVVVNDLEQLGYLLERYNIVSNINPFVTIAQNNYSTNNYWHYKIERLAFERDKLIIATGGTVPTGLEQVYLHLSIEVKGLYVEDVHHIKDPLLCIDESFPYSCNIELLAIDSDCEYRHSAWHFDKHFEHKGTGNEYIHPEYHWTYGGHKLEEPTALEQDETIYIDLGNSFVLPSPRIGHPPFDAVLIIDYIIKNYISKDIHGSLTEESEYINIVKRSQYRLWRPYALRFASHWVDLTDFTFDKDFPITKIHPELYM